MITTVNLFSNNSKAEDCTSNALKAIQEEQQDVDGCIFYFKYFLNPGNTAVTFRWDFGDGGISFDPNPTYTFSHGYSQTVTLTITDQNNCTSSKTINFGSGDCHGGFCNYAEGDDDCCFEICVDGVEGWTWELNMGNGDNMGYIEADEATMNYCYATNGIYTVTLNYYDSNNNVVATYTRLVEINSCSPDPELCDYWLCFVDYYDRSSCYESITYEYNNVSYTYVFNQTFGGNAYGPIPAIQELSAFANSLGIQYSNSQDDIEDCLKTGGNSFGHFFLNSPFKIISLNATTDITCTTAQCGGNCQGGGGNPPGTSIIGCCNTFSETGFYLGMDVEFKFDCTVNNGGN